MPAPVTALTPTVDIAGNANNMQAVSVQTDVHVRGQIAIGTQDRLTGDVAVSIGSITADQGGWVAGADGTQGLGPGAVVYTRV